MLAGDVNSVPFLLDHADYAHKPEISKSDYEEFYRAEWRSWFKSLLHPPESALFVDAFRSLHPNQKDQYTCWNTLTSARDANYGTRIDYILVDRDWYNTLEIMSCDIHAQIMGSDHCPVSISFRIIPDETQSFADLTRISKLACFVAANPGTGKKTITSYFAKAAVAPSPAVAKKRTKKEITLDAFFEPVKRVKKKVGDSERKNSQDDRTIEIETSDNTIITIDDDDDDDLNLEYLSKEVPSSSVTAWKELFSREQKIPLCHGHKEPCKSLRVNKKGINQGRLFYMCARPVGPESHPEKDQFRCKHFEWANRKRKPNNDEGSSKPNLP